jgi:hypothetical protein
MAINDNQKLNYIEVILQECVEGHPEPVLIDVAVEFLRELQESKDD